VYDADLQSYFDAIPHDQLLKCLRMRVVDRLVHRLRPIAAGAKFVVQLLQECRRAGTINDALARPRSTRI